LKIFNTDYIENKLNDDENEKTVYEDGTKALLAKKALPPNVPNLDLPFRCDDDEPRWIARPILFLNAPIIKFIHHLVKIFLINSLIKNVILIVFYLNFKLYHFIFVLFFAYFLLFQYYPAYTREKGGSEIRFAMDIGYFRIKYTEMALILWITLHMIEFLRQVN